MIRMITFTIGGRAYLNFMGNEFGHPKVRFWLQSLLFSSYILARWSIYNLKTLLVIMNFLCLRGWSSQCQATTSHIRLLIVVGIFCQMKCITVYFPLIRYQFYSSILIQFMLYCFKFRFGRWNFQLVCTMHVLI